LKPYNKTCSGHVNNKSAREALTTICHFHKADKNIAKASVYQRVYRKENKSNMDVFSTFIVPENTQF